MIYCQSYETERIVMNEMQFALQEHRTVRTVAFKSKHITVRSDMDRRSSLNENLETAEDLYHQIEQYVESRGSPNSSERMIHLAEKENHSPPSHEEPVIVDLHEFLAVSRDLRGKAPPDTAINVRGAPDADKTTTSDSLRLPFELIPQGRDIKELSFSDTIRPG